MLPVSHFKFKEETSSFPNSPILIKNIIKNEKNEIMKNEKKSEAGSK